LKPALLDLLDYVESPINGLSLKATFSRAGILFPDLTVSRSDSVISACFYLFISVSIKSVLWQEFQPFFWQIVTVH
jgi:hypothetical protein